MSQRGWTVIKVPNPSIDQVFVGWQSCVVWCWKQFGQIRTDIEVGDWYYDLDGVFMFKREEDATAFALRWS